MPLGLWPMRLVLVMHVSIAAQTLIGVYRVESTAHDGDGDSMEQQPEVDRET